MGDLDSSFGLDLKKKRKKKKLPEIQKVCRRPALPSHFLGWPWAPASFPLRNPLGADSTSRLLRVIPSPTHMQHIHLPRWRLQPLETPFPGSPIVREGLLTSFCQEEIRRSLPSGKSQKKPLFPHLLWMLL